MRGRTLIAVVAVILGLTADVAVAQAPGGVLSIGTKSAPPFAIQRQDGSWTGISIELWRQIAEDLGLAYRFREERLEALVDEVAAGRLDASVAALTVTPEREAVVDFSHPFYSTGLGIAVPAREGGGWLAVAQRFFSLEFLTVVATLLLVLFIAGLLIWLFERRRNSAQFGGSAAEGIGAGFWWSAVTMTTVGYGDKAPVTPAGRVVALVWMFIAVIVISSFTASITSSLTVNRLQGNVQGLDDLARARAASVAGSTSAAFLDVQNIAFGQTDTVEQALQMLADGRADAVVYDAPVLKYLVKERHPGVLQVLPETFRRQDYAIALPPDSPLREQVNRALLRHVGSAEWRSLLDRYLGR